MGAGGGGMEGGEVDRSSLQGCGGNNFNIDNVNLVHASAASAPTPRDKVTFGGWRLLALVSI